PKPRCQDGRAKRRLSPPPPAQTGVGRHGGGSQSTCGSGSSRRSGQSFHTCASRIVLSGRSSRFVPPTLVAHGDEAGYSTHGRTRQRTSRATDRTEPGAGAIPATGGYGIPGTVIPTRYRPSCAVT